MHRVKKVDVFPLSTNTRTQEYPVKLIGTQEGQIEICLYSSRDRIPEFTAKDVEMANIMDILINARSINGH